MAVFCTVKTIPKFINEITVLPFPFSINKDVVSFNMDTETLCAYRTVYDAVKQMACKVHEVVVDKEMLQSCKFSRQRYCAHMEEQKEKSKAVKDNRGQA